MRRGGKRDEDPRGSVFFCLFFSLEDVGRTKLQTLSHQRALSSRRAASAMTLGLTRHWNHGNYKLPAVTTEERLRGEEKKTKKVEKRKKKPKGGQESDSSVRNYQNHRLYSGKLQKAAAAEERLAFAVVAGEAPLAPLTS